MPTVPANAKKPSDHQPKDEPVDFAPVFTFEHDGQTHTFEKRTDAVLTPGFIRKNRHDESEFTFGLIEQLASEDTLEVIDNMSHADFQALQVRFGQHSEQVLGGSPGN